MTEKGDLFIHELFEQQEKISPHAIAVYHNGEEITYRELNKKANHLSAEISDNFTDEIVAIHSTRNIDMIVGVLAILKSGKAYLPIDPQYPAERIRMIMEEAQITANLNDLPRVNTDHTKNLRDLTRKTNSNSDDSGSLLTTRYDGNLRTENASLAYVLFTSGSTGKPKGVAMPHGALANLLHWQQKNSIAGPGTKTLQFAPLSFDVSFQEIFATLTTGGGLVLVDDDVRLDPLRLLNFIQEQSIQRIFLPFVALQYVTEAADANQIFPSSLQEVMTAGEQLKITPQLTRFFSSIPGITLYNQYGPTETHVVTALKLSGNPAEWPSLPTIGHQIDHTEVLILDEKQQMLPRGEEGEICISGACLADGYLHQPELTKEKFIYWNHPDRGEVRIYRTGDLGRFTSDGNIEFLGRKDEQVKIRGYRIEPGEIELLLNHQSGIKQAAVAAREDVPGQKRLVAYLIPSGHAKDEQAVRAAIEKQLPDYMMPSAFVWMDEFPKTSSGKIDKKNLPKPSGKRPNLTALYKAPVTKIEKELSECWSGLLQIDRVGASDNFFELGGNSLLALKTLMELKKLYGYDLPVTKLYQEPTVQAIAAFLGGERKEFTAAVKKNQRGKTNGDIAVIAMAARFPGANTIEELWNLLKEGKETISFFTNEELDASIPEELKINPDYIKARGIIEGAEDFDPEFFGINPKLAALMDPQQRIFMEIAWEALESGGYFPSKYKGTIGVFAGTGNNTYYLNNVQSNIGLINQVGSFQVMTANEKDYIASRTAYELNLKGPAVSVQSACSTSLLAIAEAVESIRKGQCDIALAGGVAVTVPIKSGQIYQEGAMYSEDGHNRSFDAAAAGTVFSDGAGVVLLKKLDEAIRDGDTIFSVIKGIGLNNDGGGKGSFTAPSAAGQAGAIQMAIQDGNIDPANISYIEAHGTATPLGDPIEIEGLNMAFGRQDKNQYCAIGSIKSNFGHCTAAAGVAGFIKTTLALYHQKIPASIHYTKPNPHIDFATTPFFVNTKFRDWETTGARIAGVSSFGVGGTNVHVIVEEFKHPVATNKEQIKTDEPQLLSGGKTILIDEPQLLSDSETVATDKRHLLSPEAVFGKSDKPDHAKRDLQIFNWSAKTEKSLDLYADKLADYINRHESLSQLQVAHGHDIYKPIDLADLAHGLHVNRESFNARRFVLASNTEDLLKQLKTGSPVEHHILKESQQGVVFIFPGQGSQYIHMGHELYEKEPVFKNAFDECAELLLPMMNEDIRHIIFPFHTDSPEEEKIHNTYYTQPALFTIEYAIAKLWMSWGIKPVAFIGHSIGEFVAAHLAGVYSLKDGLHLIFTRGRLMSALPRGSMLSIRAGEEKLLPMLTSEFPSSELSNTENSSSGPALKEYFNTELSIAALNSPNLSVVSGPEKTIDEFSKLLTRQGIANKLLQTSHAFHSAMMDPILSSFEKVAASIQMSDPHIPIVSTLTGKWVKENEMTVPSYWIQQLRSPVRFSDAVKTIAETSDNILLEVGPAHVLSALVRHQGMKQAMITTGGLDGESGKSDTHSMMRSLGQLWMHGIEPDWKAIDGYEYNPNIVLPSYAFDKKRCWVEPVLPHHKENVYNKNNDFHVSSSQVSDLQTHSSQTDGSQNGDTSKNNSAQTTKSRKHFLTERLKQILENASGIEMTRVDTDMNFIELGFDSLLLTQVALNLKKEFGLPISFRQLNETYGNLDSLAAYLDAQLPGDKYQNDAAVNDLKDGSSIGQLSRQIEQLAKQIATLQSPSTANSSLSTANLTNAELSELKKPFGATARIEKHTTTLTKKQQSFLDDLTKRYNKKTVLSKAYAQKNRAHMADPRVVSGFRPLTKELVYPIVVNKSKGSRLWDIDGNEYVDALNGFGSNFLGYQPDVITKALHQQIENGYELGPQHELAGEVCRLICEFTNFERSALCNTGSEAVLGAMRIARTVTGRSTIVAFSGSYHGIVDEVIVRGTKNLRSFPAAPGIMPEAVQNMLILDYGTEESLKIIQERAHEFAAILVEPVQSRRPEFQPVEFLKAIRKITTESGTALIFDEVITGFRMHPGGTQAMFGIKADLGVYGKVVAGGLPIGVIAGTKLYMDALDGGFWEYGNHSVPESGVTYFAGTFVRHPLALAASLASLRYMKEKGPALQSSLNEKTQEMADELNLICTNKGLPLYIAQFGSLWKIKFREEIPYGELLFTVMREKGIHIWDGFPCFLTEAHSASDIDLIIESFDESIQELLEAGFLQSDTAIENVKTENQPPAPGARLGRDKEGNPAWFIMDPNRPGKYLQVNE